MATTRCKICRLPEALRETINEQLKNEASHQTVMEGLAANDVKISKASIGRHAKEHLGIPRKNDHRPKVDDVSKAIENTPPPEPITFDSPDEYRERATTIDLLESAVVERRVSQLMLEAIVQNQLAIVSTMQKAFMRGDGEYPRDPIAGLKAVMELIVKLPAYSEHRINHQNSDMDEAARKRAAFVECTTAIRETVKKANGYRPGLFYESGDIGVDWRTLPGGVLDAIGIDDEAARLEVYLLRQSIVFNRAENESPGKTIAEAVAKYPGDEDEQWSYCVEDNVEYLNP